MYLYTGILKYRLLIFHSSPLRNSQESNEPFNIVEWLSWIIIHFLFDAVTN